MSEESGELFEYDEFGNYIGADLSEDDEEDWEDEESSVEDDSDEALYNGRRRSENRDLDALSDKMDSLSVSDKSGAMTGTATTTGGVSAVPSSLHAREALEMSLMTAGVGDEGGSEMADGTTHESSRDVILHSDKQYYESNEQIYGEGVEAMVELEDTQPLEQPIIEAVKQRCFMELESTLPETTFDFRFMTGLMDNPQFVRNIAVIGQLHHGKTSVLDILVKETHLKQWVRKGSKEFAATKNVRYTDTRKDEQSRGISLKSSPISLVCQTLGSVITNPAQRNQKRRKSKTSNSVLSDSKSFLLNLMDTPGHCNFVDESDCAVRISDGALLVIDACEGVTKHCEKLIRLCVRQKIQLCLCINKIDRLILDLKLPPRDAYLKLQHCISEVNSVLVEQLSLLKSDYFDGDIEEDDSTNSDDRRMISDCDMSNDEGNSEDDDDDDDDGGPSLIHVNELFDSDEPSVGGLYQQRLLTPNRGNVCFASAKFGFVFTLESFAKIYCDRYYSSCFYQRSSEKNAGSDPRQTQASLIEGLFKTLDTEKKDSLKKKEDLNNEDEDEDEDPDAVGDYHRSLKEKSKEEDRSEMEDKEEDSTLMTTKKKSTLSNDADSMEPNEFCRRLASKLWGNFYLDHETGEIINDEQRTLREEQHTSGARRRGNSRSGDSSKKWKRTFIEYILEPLYKIFSQVLGGNDYVNGDLDQLLKELGLFPRQIRKKELKLDTLPLLTIILQRFFGFSDGLTSMLVKNVPSPIDNAECKVVRCYNGHLYFKDDSTNGTNSSESSKKKKRRVDELYESSVSKGLLECDKSSEHCLINIVKMYPRPDASQFDAFGRVFSGTIKKGDKVTVMREKYNSTNKEDMSEQITVESLWIYNGRYRIEVNQVSAGNWALLGGVGLDQSILKFATLYKGPLQRNFMSMDDDSLVNIDGDIADTDSDFDSGLHMMKDTLEMFLPVPLSNIATCKVAIEPLKPSELPKMVHGLRCISKSYPNCRVKVEESGEHLVIGTGELYLDCLLYDLRELYSEIEMKVSEPGVVLLETCSERSTMECFGFTLNNKVKLSFISEPISEDLSCKVESLSQQLSPQSSVLSSRVSSSAVHNGGGSDTSSSLLLNNRHMWDSHRKYNFYKNRLNMDNLESRNVWCFGPEWEVSSPSHHCNLLVNDCDFLSTGIIDSTKAKELSRVLDSIKPSVLHGFVWAMKEGPLCSESMRSVKVRLTDLELSSSSSSSGSSSSSFNSLMDHSPGQIIPCVRRVIYSSLMLANPRLLEPSLEIEIMCPPDSIALCEDVIRKRRGIVIGEQKKPGTPLHLLFATMPVIDSFGFETDLRCHTGGQAFPTLLQFDRWTTVPGDPMDTSVVLRPLEPAPIHALSREFVLKTRKRKGLTDSVSYHKYFDTHNTLMTEAFAEHLERFYH